MAETREGKPCKNCNTTTKYKSNGCCVQCQCKKYSREFYNARKNDEEYLEYKREMWKKYDRKKNNE